MFVLLVAQVCWYILFIAWGVTVKETTFVLGPVTVGGASLIEVRLMKKPRSGRDVEKGKRVVLREGEGEKKERDM
jgi:hypothetical protein